MRSLISRFIIVFGVLVSLYLAWEIGSFVLLPPAQQGEEVVFEVPPGSSFQQVARRLEAQGLVSDQWKLRVLGRWMGLSAQLRVGEYALRPSMRPHEILEILASGKSIEYQITFPEGYNMYEMAEALDARGMISKESFLAAARDVELMRVLLGEEFETLEGYLFPETYRLTKYTTAQDLVRSMVQNFLRAYESVVRESSMELPRHKHVILASIIEKETGAADERSLVSSVFHNRLKKRMRLQSDPTIVYGVLDETGINIPRIRRVHIDTPTRYNTYTLRRLPHGPIANPGRDSLWATLNPADTEYLFFVSRNDGTHVFSKTYPEHREAVRIYQLGGAPRK